MKIFGIRIITEKQYQWMAGLLHFPSMPSFNRVIDVQCKNGHKIRIPSLNGYKPLPDTVLMCRCGEEIPLTAEMFEEAK